jgi:hypothetical protein
MPEHPGSRETYEYISDWIAPNFFYSKKDVWHRFGMLGVFADYVLSCTQGDILEIGTGESSIYLSAVAKKYQRRFITCDASPSKIVNPLTIPGYIAGETVQYLEANDPVPASLGMTVAYAGTSDSLFERVALPPLALAFIDGDHLYQQAKRDFTNLWPLVVEDGYLCLHDTYPANEGETSEHRSGEVWRLRKELEVSDRMDVLTLPRGTAMNAGLTMVRKRRAVSPEFQDG